MKYESYDLQPEKLEPSDKEVYRESGELGLTQKYGSHEYDLEGLKRASLNMEGLNKNSTLTKNKEEVDIEEQLQKAYQALEHLENIEQMGVDVYASKQATLEKIAELEEKAKKTGFIRYIVFL